MSVKLVHLERVQQYAQREMVQTCGTQAVVRLGRHVFKRPDDKLLGEVVM